MYDTLGTPANPQRLGSSPRSRVWRIELHGQPAIVKQIIGGPEPGLDNMDAGERHTREATALRLAARAHPPVAPAMIASDPAHRRRLRTHARLRPPLPEDAPARHTLWPGLRPLPSRLVTWV